MELPEYLLFHGKWKSSVPLFHKLDLPMAVFASTSNI